MQIYGIHKHLNFIQKVSQTDNLPHVNSEQGKRRKNDEKPKLQVWFYFRFSSWLVLLSGKVPLPTWAAVLRRTKLRQSPHFGPRRKQEDKATGPREGSTSGELGGGCAENVSTQPERLTPTLHGGQPGADLPESEGGDTGLSLDHWPSRSKPTRATSQPGEHTDTSCWDSLPRPAGMRPLVQVGAHQPPPNTQPSSHLLFLRSRVWRRFGPPEQLSSLAKKGAGARVLQGLQVLAVLPLWRCSPGARSSR